MPRQACAHRDARGLGQQCLLGDIASREVHETERHVAADAGELERDAASESGGATGDDRDLAAETGGDGHELRLFDGSPGRLGALIVPGE